MKILLVEDNLLNQKVVIFNLRKYNYKVVPVTNGIDAISKFENEKFDLVLMDLMLPGMNGYEITRKIREIELKINKNELIPIIAITANTLDNDRNKCFNAGMNDFLAKPFTSNELINTIKKYIR